VRVARDLVPAGADEEVQVSAYVGAEDVVDVEPFPASGRAGEGRGQSRRGLPGIQVLLRQVDREAPLLDVEADPVPGADLAERAARSSG